MKVNRAPMAAAPLKYAADGRVAWDAMWDGFCALASRGGPPHRPTMLEPDATDHQGGGYLRAQAEIIRGVGLVGGLRARPHAPGWIAASCESPGMAAWLAAQGRLEGVAMRAEGDLLLLPCGPRFALAGEIKNVITAVAKTTHYWAEHGPAAGAGTRLPVAALERLGKSGHAMSRRAFLRCSLAAGALGALLTACGATPDTRGRPAPQAGPADAAASGVAPSENSASAAAAPAVLAGFEAFAGRVTVRMDDEYIYVESDGMPDHPMMVGIQSWQQQVPLPQPYAAGNAWRIPRHAALADAPISARTALFRGAIALAVNGVPIFNAFNNRGEDAYLVGELDQWGGHAGRADDYHYHIAPLHLEAAVGPGQPIAYALDGFPIYGSTEPDGGPLKPLDEFNGHDDGQGGYHYHGTATYPYANGGMRGVVTVRDDQIEPQPQAAPVRQFLQPLRGAAITGFEATDAGGYELEYQLDGGRYRVAYRVDGDQFTFEFTDPAGTTRRETYERRAQ